MQIVPVPVFGLALRSPMRPDAELGVPVPIRGLVLFKRCPGRLKFPGSDRLLVRVDDDTWHGCGWNGIRSNMVQG